MLQPVKKYLARQARNPFGWFGRTVASRVFDKVFTANSIYFWPQPEENINEVNRVLKPGGKFFCALRLKHQMESRGSIVTGNRDVFKNLYQEDEVKQLFDNSGFNDVNSHVYHGDNENLYIVAGRK